MSNDELLELKKDVDELSMYYGAIKKEIEELEEVLFANNMMDEEEEEDFDELSDEEITSNYRSKTVALYWIIYGVLFFLNQFLGDFTLGISTTMGITFESIYVVSLVTLLSWYFYRLFIGIKKAPEKYRNKHSEKEVVDLEEIKKKLQILYERENIIRAKFNEYENKYQKEISCLEEKEREIYNEYISEYMLELLNNAEDKIYSSMLISDISSDIFDEYIVKKYELK